jgi:hypothetical protein
MALDSSGNQRVDFVWGNIPLQPNTDRTDGTPVVVYASNVTDNKSWSGYSVLPSAQLNPDLDSHEIAVNGLRGYPGFTTGGIAVPNVLRLTNTAAEAAITAAGLVPAFSGTYDVIRPSSTISPNFTIVDNVATMYVNDVAYLPGFLSGDTFWVNVDGAQIEQENIGAAVVITKVSNTQITFPIIRENVTTTLAENDAGLWSTNSGGLPGFYGAVSRVSPAVGTLVEPGSTVTYSRFND